MANIQVDSLLSPFPDDHHRVVEHLLDQLRPAQQVGEEAGEARAVAAIKFLEGGEILRADPRHQAGFVLRHRG